MKKIFLTFALTLALTATAQEPVKQKNNTNEKLQPKAEKPVVKNNKKAAEAFATFKKAEMTINVSEAKNSKNVQQLKQQPKITL